MTQTLKRDLKEKTLKPESKLLMMMNQELSLGAADISRGTSRMKR